MDELLVGPSGAGYAYLDLYPSQQLRRTFAEWTAANLARAGPMLNVINQIQARAFDPDVEREVCMGHNTYQLIFTS